MATYKELHGVNIQYRDSDATANEGDVWYNSGTSTLKMYASLGSWASGNDLNNANDEAGYLGTQTAAMHFGGRNPSVSGLTDTETYDGSTWSETADLPATVYMNAGFGTTTAGVSVGGLPVRADTDEWNGTAWTEVNDLNTARRLFRGDGIQTAALVAAGGPGSKTEVETYDGTNWTEVGDISTGGTGRTVQGNNATAICTSGDYSLNNESWDGSSWTEVANVNTGRIKHGGCGSSTSAIIFGGLITPAPPERVGGETEQWDGTSWTEVADLNTDRRNWSCSAGSSTSAVGAGGEAGGTILAATEEWDYSASVETVAFD